RGLIFQNFPHLTRMRGRGVIFSTFSRDDFKSGFYDNEKGQAVYFHQNAEMERTIFANELYAGETFISGKGFFGSISKLLGPAQSSIELLKPSGRISMPLVPQK